MCYLTLNCFHRTIAWFPQNKNLYEVFSFPCVRLLSNPIRNQKLYIFALHSGKFPFSHSIPTNSVWFLYGLPNSCTNMFLFASVGCGEVSPESRIIWEFKFTAISQIIFFKSDIFKNGNSKKQSIFFNPESPFPDLG